MTKGDKRVKRPLVLEGPTIKYKTACGSLYITVNSGPDGVPKEVFGAFGKAGNCLHVCLGALCKLASVALQSGVSVDAVVDSFKDFQCQGSCWDEGIHILSCPNAIAQYLKEINERNKDRDTSVGTPQKVD